MSSIPERSTISLHITHNLTNPYVLLHYRALLAVIRIRNAGTSTNHATTLVRSVVALIADMNQRAGSDIRIANHALAIAYDVTPLSRRLTFLTQTANRYKSVIFARSYQYQEAFGT